MKPQYYPKKCHKKCQIHSFSLKPLQNHLYYKKNTHATFCSKIHKITQSIENIYPQFNQDALFYTPAFILDIDKFYYKQNDMKMARQHQQKVREYTEANKIIYEPKPGKRYKYCAVCRNDYQDYLEHIRSTIHKKNINTSKYNSHILDTCKQLFGNQPQTKVLPSKQNKKINQICLDEEDQDQPKIIKKRKTQQQQKIQQTSTKTNTHQFYENPFYFWNMLNQPFYPYQTQYPSNSIINQGFSHSYVDPQLYFSHNFHYQYEMQKYNEALAFSRCNNISLPGLAQQPIIIDE